jgi:hypothetical protein
MTRGARVYALAGVLALTASPAAAQLGEAQLGVIGSYGTGIAARPGAGLVLGVAAGRLTYVGLRWTYYATATTTQGLPPTEVRNSQQVFAADVGMLIPEGPLEIVPEVSIGFARFAQHSRPVAGGAESADYGTELLVAPGVAVELHVAHFALIPELQYCFTGKPDLPWLAEQHGLIASLRLVRWFELRRIRH